MVHGLSARLGPCGGEIYAIPPIGPRASDGWGTQRVLKPEFGQCLVEIHGRPTFAKNAKDGAPADYGPIKGGLPAEYNWGG